MFTGALLPVQEVLIMVNQRMLGLGTARSVIRELFEYGKQRSAVVGAENVFDFSLGNPSVPAPDAINETAIRILKEQPELIHCYTSAQGDAAARQRFAASSGWMLPSERRLWRCRSPRNGRSANRSGFNT